MVAPWASPSWRGKASAWIDTNSAADALRAILTRSASGMKVSSVRVKTTRYLPLFSIRSRSASANPSTRFFSHSVPDWVPLSMPPWPGSITTTGRGSAGAAGFSGMTGACGTAGVFGGPRLRSAAGGSDAGVGSLRQRRSQFGAAFGRERLNEGGAVGLLQFEHQTRRLTVGGVEHIGG